MDHLYGLLEHSSTNLGIGQGPPNGTLFRSGVLYLIVEQFQCHSCHQEKENYAAILGLPGLWRSIAIPLVARCEVFRIKLEPPLLFGIRAGRVAQLNSHAKCEGDSLSAFIGSDTHTWAADWPS